MTDLRDLETKFETTFPNLTSTDALIKFISDNYHPDIEQKEAGQEPRKGLAAVIEAEKVVFNGMLEGGHFYGVEIHKITVDESNHTTFAEATVYAKLKGNDAKVPFYQLTEHVWKDGKVIKETFWATKPKA